MLKRKRKATSTEIYPGGRHSLPFGGSSSTPKRKQTNPVPYGIHKIKQTPRFSPGLIEKLFLGGMFIVIEIMICRVCFGVVEATFAPLNPDERLQSVFKLAQVALFLIFTYANIMICFFKVNVFNQPPL